jgi:hypothetical protein
MARTGMTDIITQLRSLTEAGTAEYSLGTLTYWSDDHLEDVLDTHRLDIDDYMLLQNPRYESGTLVYKEYRSIFEWIESGTVTYLQGGSHTAVSTADYSVDYQRGVVTFTANQSGSTYYLYGRTYDLYGAAADIWRRKASHVAQAIDFSTDNHSVKRSHLAKTYLEMAGYYASRSGFGMTGSLLYERGDTTGSWNYDRD